MTRLFTLQENVLTDNVLIIPIKGKIFRGGYIAKLKEYHYLTSQSDRETVKYFRSKFRLNKYLEKQYPQVEIDFVGTCIE